MQREGDYIFLIEDDYNAQASLMNLLSGNSNDFIALTGHPFVKYNDAGQLAFAYVGVLAINDVIICFFPKYYKRDHGTLNLTDMGRILKVLKKAGSKENFTPDYKNYSPAYQTYRSEFVIADYLIKDYLDHGLYQKDNTYLELNQPGEIDWPATINLIEPVFSKGRPIYADTLNHVSYSSSAHVITELQKFAVHSLLGKYGRLLNYHFRMYEDVAGRLEDIGPHSYLMHVVGKELTQVFTDQKIQLLKLLLAYLKGKFNTTGNRVYLFGTGYFYTVWERLCGHSISNQIEAYLPALPKPVWSDLDGNTAETDTFRPDIIHYSIAEDLLLVLDAKYYQLKLKANGSLRISGNPGIGDISKQFLYEQALNHLGYPQTLNCLLFPKLQPEPFLIAGFVSFALFPDKKLWVLYVNPDLLFDNFISNRTFSPVLISNTITEIAALI